MSDTRAKNLTDQEWSDAAEQNLYDIANGAEGMQQKLDKEGNIHDLRFKLPPNLDANKFILKNMSKGKWADKIEITSTQVNVNLTASYQEVGGILERIKAQQIEAKKEIVIDVEEVKSADSKPE